MRSLLLCLVAGAALIGCNAIFGIEVIDALPAGDGGSTSNGGSGAGASGGGTGAGSSVGGSGGESCDTVDDDGDGFSECDGDCADDDNSRAPNKPEVCGDDIDQNCDTVPDDNCVVGAYVSATQGSDTNPGTAEYPVKSIGKGISNAQALASIHEVIVGEGTYVEVVTLQPGVSVTGGHRCNADTCDWDSSGDQRSTIDPQDIPAVDAASGVDRTVVLSGFDIEGQDMANVGDDNYPTIDLDGASPTIRENHITGPSVSCSGFCSASAIRITGSGPDAGGPIIEENIIEGAQSNHVATGVDIFASAEVRSNRIALAVGRNVSAIRGYAVGATTVLLVLDNVLGAGTCSGGSPQTANALDIGGDLTGSRIEVEKNLINLDGTDQGSCLGCSDSTCGGIAIGGGDIAIVNNIVLGIANAPNSHAIFVTDGESGTLGSLIIHSNTLDGRGSPTGTTSAAISMKLIAGNTLKLGDFRNNILIGGAAPIRFGIREAEDVGDTFTPNLIAFNEFHDVTIYWRRWDGTGPASDELTIAAVNAASPDASANVALDCALTSNYHLEPGSACIDQGTSINSPNDDVDGDSRPQGTDYDIGADEFTP